MCSSDLRCALQEVGLDAHRDLLPAELSYGERQRCAIARAIVNRPALILADEPIASLDPESSRNVMEILAQMNRERGLTVLVSLHQIDFALKYCPRTIALHRGRLVYDGPSHKLNATALRSIYGGAADELLRAPAIAQPAASAASTDFATVHAAA